MTAETTKMLMKVKSTEEEFLKHTHKKKKPKEITQQKPQLDKIQSILTGIFMYFENSDKRGKYHKIEKTLNFFEFDVYK